MSTPLLTIRGLQAYYGTTHALKDIDLDIEAGGMFAILGPSGSGKSTLLRVIAGFEQAAEGTLELDGKDLLALPANKREVGLMFQSYALFPHMSVAKNIAYGLEAEKLSRGEIKTRVAEAIDMIGLGHLADRRPAQLSGGQRQRVALARSIVKRPKLLLLDEPLSALDRQLRVGMQSELKRLQRETGMTFVIVTHDQEEAMSLADSVALLRDGQIEQLGTPAELYEQPNSRFCAEFIGSSTIVEGKVVPEGVQLTGFGALPLSVPADSQTGDTVLAVIRPEQVRLTEDAGAGGSQLFGTFEGASYLGGAADAEVRVADAVLTVRCAAMPRVAHGVKVGLTLDTADIRVIAA
ncbi:MAG: ABC transporter ATP-binding protein [Actinobacteria bacterium]|nr:ABC transporter ATP-binding protein [Actinomycetota bacterium]